MKPNIFIANQSLRTSCKNCPDFPSLHQSRTERSCVACEEVKKHNSRGSLQQNGAWIEDESVQIL